jgi:hypothetical protein
MTRPHGKDVVWRFEVPSRKRGKNINFFKEKEF